MFLLRRISQVALIVGFFSSFPLFFFFLFFFSFFSPFYFPFLFSYFPYFLFPSSFSFLFPFLLPLPFPLSFPFLFPSPFLLCFPFHFPFPFFPFPWLFYFICNESLFSRVCILLTEETAPCSSALCVLPFQGMGCSSPAEHPGSVQCILHQSQDLVLPMHGYYSGWSWLGNFSTHSWASWKMIPALYSEGCYLSFPIINGEGLGVVIWSGLALLRLDSARQVRTWLFGEVPEVQRQHWAPSLWGRKESKKGTGQLAGNLKWH